MSRSLGADPAANLKGEPGALREGRLRYQRRQRAQRRRQAIKRVTAYRAWLKRGSPMREIPPVPSSADFRIWRGDRG